MLSIDSTLSIMSFTYDDGIDAHIALKSCTLNDAAVPAGHAWIVYNGKTYMSIETMSYETLASVHTVLRLGKITFPHLDFVEFN